MVFSRGMRFCVYVIIGILLSRSFTTRLEGFDASTFFVSRSKFNGSMVSSINQRRSSSKFQCQYAQALDCSPPTDEFSTEATNWTVLTIVNYDSYDFFLNWLAFYKQIDNMKQREVFVVAEDDDTLKKLNQEARIPASFQCERRTKMEETKKVKDRKSQLMISNVFTILQKLKQGMNIVYCDVRGIWRSNPFPFLESGLDAADFLGHAENLPDDPNYPYYSTLFFAIQSTDLSIQLIRDWGHAVTNLGQITRWLRTGQELIYQFRSSSKKCTLCIYQLAFNEVIKKPLRKVCDTKPCPMKSFLASAFSTIPEMII
jgi:hypothetical protein